MDTLTIIIHMTGLLLLSPAPTPGGPALQVLAAAPTRKMGEHQVRIGYFSRERTPNCVVYQKNICWVNIDGWALSFGTPNANAEPSPLPQHMADVSWTAPHSIPLKRFGNEPGTKVRARVTIYGGQVEGSCSLGSWDFGVDSLPLQNVVSYRIPNAATGRRVSLLGTRLNSHQPAPPQQVLGTVEAEDSTVNLFLFEIPTTEAEKLEGLDILTAARNHVMTTREKEPDKGAEANHYRAFYNLIGAHFYHHRPNPRYRHQIPADQQCSGYSHLAPALVAIPRAMFNVSTYSCMVASGTLVQ
jgi:hypothetical protein